MRSGAERSFNSIKVRLKPAGGALLGGLFRFQFHKGTIKTIQRVISFAKSCKFQFHKGTIKTAEQLAKTAHTV